GLPGAEATYASVDGGATWTETGQALTTAAGKSFAFGSDPFIQFDSNGVAYYSYILISSDQSSDAVVVARSTDGGLTWSNPASVFDVTGTGNFADHPAMAVDQALASQFRNSVYVAWTNFATTGGEQILLARSTDGGHTWSAPVTVGGSG